jgi:hypothetical protein
MPGNGCGDRAPSTGFTGRNAVSMQVDADSRPLREHLVGSWRLVSYEVRDEAGGFVGHPLGDDARGYLVYTADGFMSTQVMRLHRPWYRSGGFGDGTVTESAEAARGYVAYAGTYHVDGDSVVVHEPAVSLFPNWVDTTVARKALLVEPRLELTTPKPLPYGGQQLVAVLVWERVGQSGLTT